MAMVDVVSWLGSLQAGLRLKSVCLVQRLAIVWRCSAFIAWTGWTLSWWQHHKHCAGYYYYYYYYYYYCIL